MHPSEDWAETFAHYLHIRDTLQTAGAYGVTVEGPDPGTPQVPHDAFNPQPTMGEHDFTSLLSAWLPLTYALNALNRSMGRTDLYPFVLPEAVIEKLGFIHGLVEERPAADSCRSIGHLGWRDGRNSGDTRMAALRPGPVRLRGARRPPSGARRRLRGARPPTASARRSPRSAKPRRVAAASPSSATSTRSGSSITHVDEKGFVWFAPIGGWDPQILVGQRVEVQASDGAVPGVIGRKPIHLLDAEREEGGRARRPPHRHRRRRSRRALELVRIGDPVVIDAEPLIARRRPPRLALDGQPARLPTSRSRSRAAATSAASHAAASPGSPRSRRRSASTAPGRAPICSSRTSRSRSTSPTPPTPRASRRRSPAATRSARAR